VRRRRFLARHFPGTEIIAVVASNKPIAQRCTEADPTKEGNDITNLLDKHTCVISDRHDIESLPWSFSPTISMLLGRPNSQPGSRRQLHTSGSFGFMLLTLMCANRIY